MTNWCGCMRPHRSSGQVVGCGARDAAPTAAAGAEPAGTAATAEAVADGRRRAAGGVEAEHRDAWAAGSASAIAAATSGAAKAAVSAWAGVAPGRRGAVSAGAAEAAECAVAAATAGSSVRRADGRVIEPRAGGVHKEDAKRASAAPTAKARAAALAATTTATTGPAVVRAQQAVVGAAATTTAATVAVRASISILAVAGLPDPEAGDGSSLAATGAVAEEHARVPQSHRGPLSCGQSRRRRQSRPAPPSCPAGPVRSIARARRVRRREIRHAMCPADASRMPYGARAAEWPTRCRAVAPGAAGTPGHCDCPTLRPLPGPPAR